MEGIEIFDAGDLGASNAAAASIEDSNAEMRRKRLRKQENIKRACNECRQQKLRCDIVREPLSSCSRCRRLNLACKIDATFQRVEKRRRKSIYQDQDPNPDIQPSQNSPNIQDNTPPSNVALMTTENAPSTTSDGIPSVPTHPEDMTRWHGSPGAFPTQPIIPAQSRSRSNHSVAVASSRTSMQDGANFVLPFPRTLEGVELLATEVRDLFIEYFEKYHAFLPFLDPSKSPDSYYESSRLLFWVIVSVASRRYIADLTLHTSLSISVPKLMWSTLQSVPQNYHDVKALCLLCTWPFPLSSSSSDPTFMLSGTMMHLAMQLGLHRPRQAQDFSKSTVNNPLEEFSDRAFTWITCKIVAQNVATGYGQPSLSLLDDTYESSPSNAFEYQSHHVLEIRWRIESLCNRISRSLLFTSEALEDEDRIRLMSITEVLNDAIFQIEMDIVGPDTPSILILYLRCAQLHLSLYAFFKPASSENYIQSLLSLYETCGGLLSLVLDCNQEILSYSPNYVFQMTLASGFALLKLISSPLIQQLDAFAAKSVFNSSIVAVRRMSVSNNDLPGRLADVLAQLKARGPMSSSDSWQGLNLKVRSRMSVSVTFDSLWQWRRGFEVQQNPTNNDQSTASTSVINSVSTVEAGARNLSNSEEFQQEFNFDDVVFNDFYPLNWMTDTTGDMPNMSLS